MTISFRPMIPDDRQFVISGWSSSFRKSRYAGLISNKRWAKVMHPEIGGILDAPNTRTIVACEPGEVDHEGREFLYGFIAVRSTGEPHVYYCYVKRPYRYPNRFNGERLRVGRLLFEAVGIDPREPFTFAAGTAIGDEILRTCTCGLDRRDHGDAEHRFEPKFRGVHDPVPAREAA